MIRIFGYIWLLIRIQVLLTAVKLFTCRFQDKDITKVLNALATVIDSLNPIRNHGSIAHPNEDVLDEPEAILVINAIRTLLNYFEVRIKNSANKD